MQKKGLCLLKITRSSAETFLAIFCIKIHSRYFIWPKKKGFNLGITVMFEMLTSFELELEDYTQNETGSIIYINILDMKIYELFPEYFVIEATACPLKHVVRFSPEIIQI